jgi:hypothetical protein
VRTVPRTDCREWIAAAPSIGPVEALAGAAPALRVAGVQLASRHDPRGEAELQAGLVPADARHATVYGPGQGELVRALLRRPALETLRVVILNRSVTRVVLERVPCDDWLGDRRVELVRPGPDDALEAPFAAAPADLRLADEEGARLRDLVALELATPHLRRRLRSAEAGWLENVRANELRFGSDPDVSTLFDSQRGATLCVAAAGPTLARHMDELGRRAAMLVAVDAALGPLLDSGVRPAFVVTQDPHPQGPPRFFDRCLDGLEASVLCYFPTVAPGVPARWPGARVVARDASSFWERAGGPSAGRSPLFASGSVLHPAVDLARRLGARRIELFGADFAHVGGASHVAGVPWRREWHPEAVRHWVLDGHGQRVPTLPNLVGYLRDLEAYVATHPSVEFVRRSAAGAAIRGVRLEEPA